jgi:hypothetical protein
VGVGLRNRGNDGLQIATTGGGGPAAALGSFLGDDGLFCGPVGDCGGTAVWIRRLFCAGVAYVIDGVASSRVLSPRWRTPTSWAWIIAQENRNLLIYFVALFFKLDQSS